MDLILSLLYNVCGVITSGGLSLLSLDKSFLSEFLGFSPDFLSLLRLITGTYIIPFCSIKIILLCIFLGLKVTLPLQEIFKTLDALCFISFFIFNYVYRTENNLKLDFLKKRALVSINVEKAKTEALNKKLLGYVEDLAYAKSVQEEVNIAKAELLTRTQDLSSINISLQRENSFLKEQKVGWEQMDHTTGLQIKDLRAQKRDLQDQNNELDNLVSTLRREIIVLQNRDELSRVAEQLRLKVKELEKENREFAGEIEQLKVQRDSQTLTLLVSTQEQKIKDQAEEIRHQDKENLQLLILFNELRTQFKELTSKNRRLEQDLLKLRGGVEIQEEGGIQEVLLKLKRLKELISENGKLALDYHELEGKFEEAVFQLDKLRSVEADFKKIEEELRVVKLRVVRLQLL